MITEEDRENAINTIDEFVSIEASEGVPASDEQRAWAQRRHLELVGPMAAKSVLACLPSNPVTDTARNIVSAGILVFAFGSEVSRIFCWLRKQLDERGGSPKLRADARKLLDLALRAHLPELFEDEIPVPPNQIT